MENQVTIKRILEPEEEQARAGNGIPPGEKTPTLEDGQLMTVRSLLPHLQHRFAYNTTWMGIRALKNPFDAWVYQEIIVRNKPDVIIEIGCYQGGGALFLANVCDMLGSGRVIGIDAEGWRIQDEVKAHKRITFIIERAEKCVDVVRSMIRDGESVMVIEDSAHDAPTCLKQLKSYGPLVTSGQYFIVEDTIHGAGVGLNIGPNPGSHVAVWEFMQTSTDFEVDRSVEDLVITWCPGSFLRKK